MFTSLRFIITPPIFEDENRTRVAGLLNVILISCMGVAVCYLISRFFLPTKSLTGIAIVFGTILLLALAWISLRRGHVEFSSLKVTVGLWLIVTLAIGLHDARGIYNPAFVFYNALIVIAGLLLGGRAALVMALLTALMSLGIAAGTPLEVHELLVNLSSPAHWWLTVNLSFVTTAILIATSHRGLLEALDRARSSERILREYTNQLEQEVVERRQVETQLLSTQDKLVAKTDLLALMNSVADVLHSSLDFKVVIECALDLVVVHTQAPSATLCFRDPQSGQILIVAGHNIPEIALQYKRPHKPEGSLTYLAIKQKQIVSSQDLFNDERINLRDRQAFIEGGFKSGIVVPLLLHEEVFGTIGLIFKEVYTLTSEERALLLSVGRTIALAIANAQYVTRIEAEVEEHRKTEAALRAAETKYRSIYENAVEGIFQTKPDGSLLSVNPAMAHILGYDSPEQLLHEISNVAVQLYVDPEQRRTAIAILERDGQAHYENQLYRKDGSVITAANNARVVRDEQGHILYYEGMLEDITERKRLQAREMELAVALERERVAVLKQFLHCATHDLRTPLTAIYTSLDLLRRTIGDPERQPRYIDQITEQTQRIHQMIENMFTLSELDTGTAQYYFEPYPINSVVNEVCKKTRALAERKQHQVMLDPSPDLPDLRIDNVVLTTALRHVLVNALNYTNDGGQICLRTYQRTQAVVIEVTDNGIGISPDDLPRIFERFYRADKARQVDTGMSGLGLTIAQKFVEAHGGSIEVESQPEHGSTFRLVLPHNV